MPFVFWRVATEGKMKAACDVMWWAGKKDTGTIWPHVWGSTHLFNRGQPASWAFEEKDYRGQGTGSFFEEEEDEGKQRTTLKLKEKSLKGKRREEKLWRQRCLFVAGEEKTDKEWRPPKEKCWAWKCTPPWPWDHSGWRTASTEVSWKENKGEQRRSRDSFKKV